jgi:nucleoside-diphosphate-sugar epimerase
MFLSLILFCFFVSFLPFSSCTLFYSSSGHVLVFGSGGLVGSALVNELHNQHFTTLQVFNRTTLDLRNPLALDSLTGPISFAYFLACEVGGSKFIDSKQSGVQLSIIQHNLLIYQAILPKLHKAGIPYLFTSSYLQSQETAYGSIKRLGEQWIKAANEESATQQMTGRVVRLWNIYGAERLSMKSHVISDWVNGCISGTINGLTDGTEVRQFLHTRDTAKALILLMKHFDSMEFVTDLSFNQWVSLIQLAEIIQTIASQHFQIVCHAEFSSEKARVREKVEPRSSSALYKTLHWKPSISLQQGIKEMFEYYLQQNQPIEQASNGNEQSQTVETIPVSSHIEHDSL